MAPLKLTQPNCCHFCVTSFGNVITKLWSSLHNVQYIGFLGIYSSALYSLKGSIENRFFNFFAYIFFLNADYNIFT